MSKDYKPGDPAVQLQLRLCALDSSVPQDDAFPPGLVVKVNGRLLPLPNAIPTNKPGVEPKRPPRPLNITTVCHTNTGLPNKLHISWTHEYGKAFVCAVYLVQRHNASALLERLKKKRRASVEATKVIIILIAASPINRMTTVAAVINRLMSSISGDDQGKVAARRR